MDYCKEAAIRKRFDRSTAHCCDGLCQQSQGLMTPEKNKKTKNKAKGDKSPDVWRPSPSKSKSL